MNKVVGFIDVWCDNDTAAALVQSPEGMEVIQHMIQRYPKETRFATKAGVYEVHRNIDEDTFFIRRV